MSAYPWIFPPMHIQMVRAAEQGGMLDEMLDDLSAYVEHELAMKRLIKQETFYPKLVLFFAVMILGKPGFFEALPAFSKWVLGSMGKEVYTTGSYLADTVGFALTMLVPIFAVVVVFRVFLYNKSGVREAYDTIKTTLPGLGNIVKMFVMAKFMRVYAALYRAGFSMSSTLEIAGESCGNVLMRNAARRAIPLVERGGLVSEALARSGFMPPMAVDMFRTGETTGGMDQMLSKMADYYEAEAKLKSHQLALIFSAAVFLTVAFLVGMAVIRFWSGYATGVSSQG
jgi:type II secretory pathway component PulF